MMQFCGNTGEHVPGHGQRAALIEQQVVNEKDQQLFIVEIVTSGVLALIPVDEGLTYNVIGTFLTKC